MTIKRLGNFSIPIKVFHEHQAEVKVEVVKEGGAVEVETPASPPEVGEDKSEEETKESQEIETAVEEKVRDEEPAEAAIEVDEERKAEETAEENKEDPIGPSEDKDKPGQE